MDTLNIAYSQWKLIRGTVSLPTYYLVINTNFQGVIVDLKRNFIYSTVIMSTSDKSDFNANIKPNAILEPSVDACTAAQVIGQ